MGSNGYLVGNGFKSNFVLKFGLLKNNFSLLFAQGVCKKRGEFISLTIVIIIIFCMTEREGWGYAFYRWLCCWQNQFPLSSGMFYFFLIEL